MFPSDGTPTIVSVAGAPAGLKGAMFPPPTSCRHGNHRRMPNLNGAMFRTRRDRPDLRSRSGSGFPTTGPAFPTACPPPLCLTWGSRPWTARGKRSLPNPTPSRSPQPQAFPVGPLSVNGPAPARFPRFVHGAGPQTNRRRGGRRVENATPPLIEWGDVHHRPGHVGPALRVSQQPAPLGTDGRAMFRYAGLHSSVRENRGDAE